MKTDDHRTRPAPDRDASTACLRGGALQSLLQTRRFCTAALWILLAVGCMPPNGDPGNDGGPNDDPFAGQAVFSGLRTAILSISGSSANEVYAVGADLGGGGGPNFLAFNGQSWRRLPTGATDGDLWWITTQAIDGAFYLVGRPGLIFRFNPNDFTFDQFDTPARPTLFGIWGTAADNLWAVGGELSDPDRSGVIWHFDGISWTVADLQAVYPDGVPLLYKVWGRSENEVYAVGAGCTTLRFDGTRWSSLTCNASGSLLTVHGNPASVIAVGGLTQGVIAELDAAGFVDTAPGGLPRMSGVFVPELGRPVAVGARGSIATRDETGWALQQNELGVTRDFHAAWIDSSGGIWAVGGNLGPDLNDGIIAYFGARTIPDAVSFDDP